MRNEEREFTIADHVVRINLVGNGWSVSVDGKTLLGSCATAYAAWALGVAECYRLKELSLSSALPVS